MVPAQGTRLSRRCCTACQLGRRARTPQRLSHHTAGSCSGAKRRIAGRSWTGASKEHPDSVLRSAGRAVAPRARQDATKVSIEGAARLAGTGRRVPADGGSLPAAMPESVGFVQQRQQGARELSDTAAAIAPSLDSKSSCSSPKKEWLLQSTNPSRIFSTGVVSAMRSACSHRGAATAPANSATRT